MLPFVQLAQFREIRPNIRFAHYTETPLNVPARFIHDHELILIERGQGTLYTDRGLFRYKEHSLLLIPPGTIHSFKDDPIPDQEQGPAHWAVHFDWEPREEHSLLHIVGEEEGPITPEQKPDEAAGLSSLWLTDIVQLDEIDPSLRHSIRDMVNVYDSAKPHRKLELQAVFLKFLLQLMERLQQGTLEYTLLTDNKQRKKRPRSRTDMTDYILKMHDAVRAPVVSSQILNEWKQSIYFSVPHFHRLFKEQTGCAPLEYFTKLRMEKAAQLLLGTTLPVNEIAYLCGYEDSKYFSRLFRQAEGLSPMQYRRNLLHHDH